jgi:hypothetical protein
MLTLNICHYSLIKNREVVPAFLVDLKDEHAPSYPSVHQVSQRAKARRHYADLVVRKLRV